VLSMLSSQFLLHVDYCFVYRASSVAVRLCFTSEISRECLAIMSDISIIV